MDTVIPIRVQGSHSREGKLIDHNKTKKGLETDFIPILLILCESDGIT